ncbi:MAG: outer membrane protein assembly factor BamD, partial [Rickettsiella sp.]|nr:outer membrane protein assembly factor BamD [Rickettsiella sp.]
PMLAFRDQSVEQIYQNAKGSLANGNYAHAIKAYEALDVIYPFNRYSERAQLDLIFSYYQNGNSPAAKAAAERFIHLYPNSGSIDYAYYMRALADMDQDRGWYLRYVPIDLSMRDPGTMRPAYQEFEQLIDRYPQSRYVADAKQRMIYLRNLFASYELHIADYYFRKKAYVAAANRANNIVQRYQGAPEVEKALIIMIKSYRALGLEELANQSLTVFKLNFPDTSFSAS